MDYDVIIIGATATACGMLSVYGDSCLIIERRPQAFYEFLGAMKFGSGTKMPESDIAKELYLKLADKGVFTEFGDNYFVGTRVLYSYLKDANVFLNMEILSIENIDGGFKVKCTGVSGIREFTATKIINTTTEIDNIDKKSINFLVCPKSEGLEPICDFGQAVSTPSGMELDRIMKIKLNQTDDYIAARRAIFEHTNMKAFDNYSMYLTGDCFDVTCRERQYEKNGITYMCSASFDNPTHAFDGGVLFARGNLK